MFRALALVWAILHLWRALYRSSKYSLQVHVAAYDGGTCGCGWVCFRPDAPYFTLLLDSADTRRLWMSRIGLYFHLRLIL